MSEREGGRTGDPFASLYNVHGDEISAFGGHWCGKDRAESWVEELVAAYPKDPADGDGQPVEVYRLAVPAVFYTVRGLPSTNGVGKPVHGFSLSFGSGRDKAKLAAEIAALTAQGMCGVDIHEPATPASAVAPHTEPEP